MRASEAATVREVVDRYHGDRGRLLSMLQALQRREGTLSPEALAALAAGLALPPAEVVDAASFYPLLRRAGAPRRVYLARCLGCGGPAGAEVASAFAEALGAVAHPGAPEDGLQLAWTQCLGACDQGPAALVDGTLLTRLSPGEVPWVVGRLAAGAGLGGRVHVAPGLREPGPILFQPIQRGAGLWKALAGGPEAVVEALARARLRGRGGAGFPTATKWRLTRGARTPGPRHVICNAHEGEPGTFKDRVLLTEAPDLVLEGMTIAGLATGAREGLLYLRAEYAWLRDHLEAALARRRALGLLGAHVCGSETFGFDVRVQVGAGTYVCGEETALIESLEGKRGAPRDRPPYPTDRGYQAEPTVLDNAETFACVTRILEHGPERFTAHGTAESSGTKLLSVSGDCARPGVYELPWGTTVRALLERAGGTEDAAAVVVGGPSGRLVAPKDFGRQLSYEDLPTGGAFQVVGRERDVLALAAAFQGFFAEESCGWCVPCRLGTAVLARETARLAAGGGGPADLEPLRALALTVKRMSRCGLGQSAPHPLLSTLRDFPELWEARLSPAGAGAVQDAREAPP